MRQVIKTLIYTRKPTQEEIAGGMKKSHRVYAIVPAKDMFLGVNDVCAAQFKKFFIGQDGLRYYYECINYTENISL